MSRLHVALVGMFLFAPGLAHANMGSADSTGVAPDEGAVEVLVPAEGAAEAADAPAGEDASEAPPPDAAAYAAALRSRLTELNATVTDKLIDKMMAKQDGQMGVVGTLLGWVSLAGLLLLGVPLALRSRYPGKSGLMMKHSALAALLFFLAIQLLSAVLMLLRTTQAVVGSVTNPQIAMLHGVFDTLDKNADDMVALSSVIDPTLAKVAQSDEPFVAVLMDNLQAFRDDVEVFKSVASAMRSLDWLFALLPTVMAVLAVVLFLLSFKPLLLDIIRMPVKAAQGATSGAWAATKKMLGDVGKEFLSVICLILVLIVVSVFSGGILSHLVQPVMEALLAFSVAGFFYLQMETGISSGLLLVSLNAAALFLMLNIGVVLAGNVFFLSKAQKILRQRFYEGVPLGAHRAFWGKGTLALVWSQVLPLGFILVGSPAVEAIFDKALASSPPRFIPAMLGSGALLVLGFLFVYWLTRGFKALRYLARYDVQGYQRAVEVDD